MNKDEKLKLSNEIKYDIEKGIYNLYPKIEQRMSLIASKLFESIYVVNSSKELFENEIEALEEQGYNTNNY